MKKLILTLAVIGGLAASPALAAEKPEPPTDPGPPPASFEAFEKLATPALLEGFFDPEAAQITWDRGIVAGWWQNPRSKKIPGWFTCGLVNGKNRMGGYVGARRFVVVYFNGRIVYSEVASPNPDKVSKGCENAIANGVLPPADLGLSTAPAPLTGPRIGIDSKMVVPDGLYVSGVGQNTAAANAGITPGMVVSHVNGVSLRGLDHETSMKIMRATGPTLTLTIVGKGDVTLTKSDPGATD